jgi:hypothetical protein
MIKGSGAQRARRVSRVHRGEAFWREALSRQQASGLAQREFCDREGLSVSTFALWSRRIGDAEVPAGPVQFVEVTPPAAKRAATASNVESAMHIRLDLGGIVLEIVRG